MQWIFVFFIRNNDFQFLTNNSCSTVVRAAADLGKSWRRLRLEVWHIDCVCGRSVHRELHVSKIIQPVHDTECLAGKPVFGQLWV